MIYYIKLLINKNNVISNKFYGKIIVNILLTPLHEKN